MAVLHRRATMDRMEGLFPLLAMGGAFIKALASVQIAIASSTGGSSED